MNHTIEQDYVYHAHGQAYGYHSLEQDYEYHAHKHNALKQNTLEPGKTFPVGTTKILPRGTTKMKAKAQNTITGPPRRRGSSPQRHSCKAKAKIQGTNSLAPQEIGMLTAKSQAKTQAQAQPQPQPMRPPGEGGAHHQDPGRDQGHGHQVPSQDGEHTTKTLKKGHKTTDKGNLNKTPEQAHKTLKQGNLRKTLKKGNFDKTLNQGNFVLGPTKGSLELTATKGGTEPLQRAGPSTTPWRAVRGPQRVAWDTKTGQSSHRAAHSHHGGQARAHHHGGQHGANGAQPHHQGVENRTARAPPMTPLTVPTTAHLTAP